MPIVRGIILNEISLNALLKVLVWIERRIILVAIVVFTLLNREKLFSVEGLSLTLYPVTLGSMTKIPHAVGAANTNATKAKFPTLSAKSVLVADLNTTRILYQKNPDTILAPASTTKLMTALVSLDLYSLDEILPISNTPEKCLNVEGNRLDLTLAEEISVKDLLHATLISSSNDAACILANTATTEETFVQLMNQKALQFGMVNTIFTNPVGFDSFDYSHKSTAKDLYILAQRAKANALIKEIYAKPFYNLETGNIPRTIYSTNQLLTQISGSVGIKTGTTSQAREVLIYEYADEDKDLLIILMGSEARFPETKAILNWLENNFVWY